MATTLSNIGAYGPLPCSKICRFSSPKCPTLLRAPNKTFCKSVTRAAADKRQNLDHLQRVNPKLAQPSRVIPVAPQTGLWERFPTARTVQQMMDTMERTTEDPFAYIIWPSLAEREREGYSRGRTPWAIKESEKDYKMRFDVPGMTRGDVKVWVEENMLVVKAEKIKKKQEGEVNANDEEDWPASSFGKYSSRIALPENIEFEKIKAEVRDGVLYITIPKAITASKIIDIDVQ